MYIYIWIYIIFYHYYLFLILFITIVINGTYYKINYQLEGKIVVKLTYRSLKICALEHYNIKIRIHCRGNNIIPTSFSYKRDLLVFIIFAV